MTVGRPAGASGGARSLQIFPPKSSSDTEAEEELSGDGLVLPRAGKLDEFLNLEETDSTSPDSTRSFYETLQVLKQKGRWCVSESLHQSDPDSDEHLSEDDEDLESFFQDKSMGKLQVRYPPSPSFLEKEEQRKEAAQQRELAATAKVKVSKQKTTRRIPKSILEPALGDKLQETELFRKIRIQMRALDMLQKASSPITSSSCRADPQLRTATRTQEKKLGFLHTDFGFQPRVNSAVPDYEDLYKAFQRRAAKRRVTREVTRSKPFLLRTASLCHTQRPCDAATTGGKKDSPQPPATPRPRSRSLSGLASLSANTLPVHITDATRRRESAVRSSLEKKDKADESTQWLEMHKKKCQAMSKSVTLRAKAMDPHKSLEEVFKAKLKENRNNDRKRAKEYKKQLEEMKKRIQTRPYLFEQVTKDLARKEAEQRYQDTLKQAGLDEDFVRNKVQGTRAVQWKEQSEIHACPSTHETTKFSIRNPQQDLEEPLEQPTGPKTEQEELSYELLDNLKSLA
ncbi:protein FAM161B isoform X2 [Molossus molossus]|uniref:protein FAM161B isoform X2 n=1 Tax=Molossus molossus TaxID=27622 RepID=UPI001745FCE4|nr:protein FAM161B isoform X2 [Molossus molossus]